MYVKSSSHSGKTAHPHTHTLCVSDAQRGRAQSQSAGRIASFVVGFPHNPARHNMGVYLVESWWLSGTVPSLSRGPAGSSTGKSTRWKTTSRAAPLNPRFLLRRRRRIYVSNSSSHRPPDPGRGGFAVSFRGLDGTGRKFLLSPGLAAKILPRPTKEDEGRKMRARSLIHRRYEPRVGNNRPRRRGDARRFRTDGWKGARCIAIVNMVYAREEFHGENCYGIFESRNIYRLCIIIY